MKAFTRLKLLAYDFYVFTQVMICYLIFGGLCFLKFFCPGKSYQGIALGFTDFVARHFTSRKESFFMGSGIDV